MFSRLPWIFRFSVNTATVKNRSREELWLTYVLVFRSVGPTIINGFESKISSLGQKDYFSSSFSAQQSIQDRVSITSSFRLSFRYAVHGLSSLNLSVFFFLCEILAFLALLDF